MRDALAPLALGAMLAQPASALEVAESVSVKAAPEQAWEAIAEWCSIAEWHPVIENCTSEERDGELDRTLTTTDGAESYERRLSFSDQNMSSGYEIIESPLPVANYQATSQVRPAPAEGGALIGWPGVFDAASGTTDQEARHLMTNIYEAGLNNLQDRLGAP